MNTILNQQKGISIVILTIMVTVLLSMLAISVDVGVVVFEKTKLTNAVDAAALSGAQELVRDEEAAKSTANDYLSRNVTNLKQTNVVVNHDQRQIEVTAVKTVQNAFAKIFGNASEDISASAKARVENIKSATGIRPLAIADQDFSYGMQYTLKEGAMDGDNGNYGGIALGGNGAAVYVENILAGYSGVLSVGNQIETETGNIAAPTKTAISQLLSSCTHVPECTYQSYNPKCEKIITIPVVNTMDVNGKKVVTVVGFATFFLENVINNGGQTDIVGRFISYNLQGETSNDVGDYGTYGLRLIK
jgi:hypothetical protein